MLTQERMSELSKKLAINLIYKENCVNTLRVIISEAAPFLLGDNKILKPTKPYILRR